MTRASTSPKARLAKPVLTATLAALALFQTGCSTFNRDWNQARKHPAQGIEGAWDGQWISDVNGHNGRLRCLIERPDGQGYVARYRANYWGILRFGYSVPLEVQPQSTNGSWSFQGEANLGKLAGGVYRYEGSASTNQFQSSYHSKYDHGQFQLHRPSIAP